MLTYLLQNPLPLLRQGFVASSAERSVWTTGSTASPAICSIDLSHQLLHFVFNIVQIGASLYADQGILFLTLSMFVFQQIH